MKDRIKECRSCGASIVWLKTVRGKSIPVDADTIHDYEVEIFDHNVHTAHFATCPDADKFRKRRRRR